MRPSTRVAALAAVIALVVAACGGGEPAATTIADGAPSETPTTTGAGATMTTDARIEMTARSGGKVFAEGTFPNSYQGVSQTTRIAIEHVPQR